MMVDPQFFWSFTLFQAIKRQICLERKVLGAGGSWVNFQFCCLKWVGQVGSRHETQTNSVLDLGHVFG